MSNGIQIDLAKGDAFWQHVADSGMDKDLVWIIFNLESNYAKAKHSFDSTTTDNRFYAGMYAEKVFRAYYGIVKQYGISNYEIDKIIKAIRKHCVISVNVWIGDMVRNSEKMFDNRVDLTSQLINKGR